MKNIWLIFAPMVMACLLLIIFCAVATKKRIKYYLIIDIIVVAMVIFIITDDWVFVKDLTSKETTTINVEYVDYFSGASGQSHPFSRKMYFNYNGKELVLFAPTVTKFFVKMEKGKVYTITFYNNSRVIESYKLTE